MLIKRSAQFAGLAAGVLIATACASASAGAQHSGQAAHPSRSVTHHRLTAIPPGDPLPQPTALAPVEVGSLPGQGTWQPAGRLVRGMAAVYETTLLPPGGQAPAGIAWMDTHLLAARLYSGSVSPGGGPYQFTAPVLPAQARSLVAAFNGGFKMKDAEGGYYTEGRVVDPLRLGAASLVIYANGNADIGAWGDPGFSLTADVASVRQNLTLLVADAVPTPAAYGNWRSWGDTCGATSCLPSVPGIDHQWRSGLGITADGALVYVAGPALSPLQLATLLVRAGAVRAMELDINPYWPVFVTYSPAAPGGLAAPANGSKLLQATVQGPATFFEPSWARDFVAMSARP